MVIPGYTRKTIVVIKMGFIIIKALPTDPRSMTHAVIRQS